MRKSKGKHFLIAAFLLAAAGLCVGAASGSPARRAVQARSWLAPVTLASSSKLGLTPEVAMNAEGMAVAAWEHGSNVLTSVRPANSVAWRPATPLLAAGRDVQGLRVAINARGDAVAIWESEDAGEGRGEIVQAAVRLARGRWQAPVTLSSWREPRMTGFDVAISPAGEAVAVWQRSEHDGPEIVQASVRTPSGGVWEAPVTLSAPSNEAENSAVAIDASGNAIAVWEAHEAIVGRIYDGRVEARSEVIQAAVRHAGTRGWRAPMNLSPSGQQAEMPHVALDEHGDAVVVWENAEVEEKTESRSSFVQAAVGRIESGIWGAPEKLSGLGHGVSGPEIALDPRGTAMVIWQHDEQSSNGIEVAVGAASSGVWQPAVRLARWSHEPPPVQPPCHQPGPIEACSRASIQMLPGAAPQIALDARGDAVAVWERASAYAGTIQATLDRAGRRWQTPANLSPANVASPQVALDGHATAIVVWSRRVRPVLADSPGQSTVEADMTRDLRRLARPKPGSHSRER